MQVFDQNFKSGLSVRLSLHRHIFFFLRNDIGNPITKKVLLPNVYGCYNIFKAKDVQTPSNNQIGI